MTETLEQHDLASKESNRRWLWINRVQWTRTDEAAAPTDLWEALATPGSLRRVVARLFASAVGKLEGVSGVWVTDLKDDLDVAIALDDPSLEPKVRNIFIDLICERLDPSEGELFVFPSDRIPEWVENGERSI